MTLPSDSPARSPTSRYIALADRPPTGSVRLHYRDWRGSGPPLLLLHGLSSGARIWDFTAPLLTPQFRVIALDQRGHGLSDQPGGNYSFADVTSDLIAFIQSLELDRPVIAGHSWGGNVAVQLAADQPQLVRALVLIDGGFLEVSAQDGMTWERAESLMRPPDIDGAPLDGFLRAARSFPDFSELWNDELQEMFLSNFEVREGKVYRRLPIPEHMKIVRAMWEQKPSQLWEKIRCPVLMIPAVKAQSDPQRELWTRAKLQAIEVARSKLAMSEVIPMEDTIHDVPLQRPKELADAIVEFASAL